MKSYEKANSYFAKMLSYALATSQNIEELIAYDKIGMCWYYQGKIGKAKFFHNRMKDGELES